jgi:hypothetical protein
VALDAENSLSGSPMVSCRHPLVAPIYRLIEEEKKRLQEAGVDFEEIRLLCRYLSNLVNRDAETRYLAYSAQMRLAL